jgi:hypothetical protein
MKQSTIDALISVGGVVLTLLGGIVTWALNERSKRIHEEYKWKEERYSGLIRSFRGFYVNLLSKELREGFLKQLNLCWMYCPDNVIRKAYGFLLTVHTGAESSSADKEASILGRLDPVVYF